MKMPGKCVSLTSGLALLPISAAIAAEPGVNALDYPGPAWSPYVVGAGIGVLSWLTFYFMKMSFLHVYWPILLAVLSGLVEESPQACHDPNKPNKKSIKSHEE